MAETTELQLCMVEFAAAEAKLNEASTAAGPAQGPKGKIND